MPPVTTASFFAAMDSSSYGAAILHHVHAAIDRDVGAGDIARLLGGEESHHCGDLLRPGEAPHGNLRHDLVTDLLADRHHHFGFDVARRHGVHRDALLHNFLRQRLGEAGHPGLGRGVVGLAELPLDRVDRGDVDDAAPAALAHAVDHLARHVEHAVQVGVDHRHPVLLGHALEHRVARDAGVVVEDVDRAHHRGRVVEHRRAGIELRDVALGGVHAVALGTHAREPLVLFLVARKTAGDDRMPGASQPAADRAADAAHAAGDERDARYGRYYVIALDVRALRDFRLV